MTKKEFDKLYDRIGFISNQLGVLVEYARIADTRGRVIAEMWEKMEQKSKESTFDPNKWYDETKIKPITLDVRPYDWWRLENGYYAKVYRTVLEGVVYQEDGKELANTTWNPLNCKSDDYRLDKSYDLKNRKSGENPPGWPEWCK